MSRTREEPASSRAGRNGPAIEARGLVMRYGDREVLHGIDLVVPHGMVVGFLGPNGAGKTTTVEILEGYRRRTAGQASLLGMDPATGGRELRERIGIVLQETGHNVELTVRETVRQFAGYYRRPRPVDEVIELVGLQEAADRRVGALSGGQRRRLDVGLALVGDPELVFLDEPTTGFDPAARRQAWETIRSLRGLGKTILLTTHYMEEAQALADRVAFLR
ncbi:MAG TPA: ABC transporter ATP-binding protein, partial [Actinomycetes bacterium]|nr:ABC transporter ATP-binding protein [Actinomycetes bacterium]